MLDDETAERMFKKIDDTSHEVNYYKPYSSKEEVSKTGTTHISIIDKHGNGCGATTSINAQYVFCKCMNYWFNSFWTAEFSKLDFFKKRK